MKKIWYIYSLSPKVIRNGLNILHQFYRSHLVGKHYQFGRKKIICPNKPISFIYKISPSLKNENIGHFCAIKQKRYSFILMILYWQPFECQECNVSFQKWESLRTHNNYNHSDGQFEKFSCSYDDCNKSYNKKQSLKIHVRTIHFGLPHNKPKSPFICETCGKSFVMRLSFRVIFSFKIYC